MKSDNPRFSLGSGILLYCEDCPFDEGDSTHMTELCRVNDCPTAKTYVDAVALAEGEPNH